MSPESLRERCVGPRDCAFCLALPLDRSAFVRAAGPQFDYVPRWIGRLGSRRDPISAAWSHYAGEGVPAALARLCDELGEMGVQVERAATIDGLARCFRERHVVMFMGHFAACPITTDCILQVDHLLAMVDHEEHWVLQELRRALRWRRLWRLLGSRGHGDRQCVAARLDLLVAQSRGRRTPPSVPSRAHARRPEVTRLWLEYSLMPAIAAGKPLELADGMHSAWEILERAIPDDRECVLDMTSCNAVELAEIFRVMRRDCRVVAPHRETSMLAGVLLIRAVVDQLRRRPRPYFDAYLQAVDTISRVLGKEPKP